MSSNAVDRRPQHAIAAEALRPNPGQWEAYTSDGNCVVLAGPGSGKTKTLTLKLARFLSDEVTPPRKVACLTYNNECVRELRRRLRSLGINETRKLFIGTVHSFCFQNVVLPYAKLAGLTLPDPLSIATAGERDDCFALAVRDVISVDTDPKDLKDDAFQLRITVPDRTSPEWQGLDPRHSLVIERYEQILRERGFIDFDDMALLGHRLITEQDWVRKLLLARFPILVIDEYQDLGVPLHHIVLSLLASQMRILAVGDPNQSIYGFAGARPQLLENLSRLDGVTVAQLNFNYRCGRNIVATSRIALPRPNEEVSQVRASAN